jgi:hypothetical protein
MSAKRKELLDPETDSHLKDLSENDEEVEEESENSEETDDLCTMMGRRAETFRDLEDLNDYDE